MAGFVSVAKLDGSLSIRPSGVWAKESSCGFSKPVRPEIKESLVIVQPETVIRWHRKSFCRTRSNRLSNDGSVTVASQARVEAQEQTLSIRAWDYGHVDIRHSPEVVERMNLLLDDHF